MEGAISYIRPHSYLIACHFSAVNIAQEIWEPPISVSVIIHSRYVQSLCKLAGTVVVLASMLIEFCLYPHNSIIITLSISSTILQLSGVCKQWTGLLDNWNGGLLYWAFFMLNSYDSSIKSSPARVSKR